VALYNQPSYCLTDGYLASDVYAGATPLPRYCCAKGDRKMMLRIAAFGCISELSRITG
jgi:hypothetical protein